MHLLCTIQHGETSVTIDLPCGHGNKTVKWLAIAAMQRYTIEAPRGRLRRREKKPHTISTTQLQCCSVASEECSYYSPSDVINEVFYDGQEITVMLAAGMAVDGVGAPFLQSGQHQRWKTIAFSQRPEVVEGAKMEEDNAQRREREETERRERAELLERLSSKADHMREILKSQLYDPARIRFAADEDWFRMNPHGEIAELEPDAVCRRRLREKFNAEYANICEVFKVSAASGTGIGTHKIEFLEFSNFIHEANIFSTTEDEALLESIFHECCVERISKHQGESEIDRHDFFVALLLLAKEKYSLKNAANMRTSDLVRVGMGMEGGMYAPLDSAFTNLMNEYVMPFIEKFSIGPPVKTALGTIEILAMLADNEAPLRECFRDYSSAYDDRPGQKQHDDELNLREFGKLLSDAGLFGEGQEMSAQQARQAFAGAQQENLSTDDGDTATTSSSHLEQMNFPEFIEAIARVGVVNSDPEAQTIQEKIERAVEKVVQLQDRRRKAMSEGRKKGGRNRGR
mmetsp:Transcript_39812/g.124410  ORF Transcript_39812/g.124410 Transcript_39812/m.124410 type:complete len:515 (-) Transcript_39812:2070-3614(-)